MKDLINEIAVDISNDPITGLKRKLFHYRFEINERLEMIHYRKIVFYEKIDDGTEAGAYGRPISEVITSDLTVEDSSKELKLKLLAPQYLHVNTQNVFVNPATGQPVERIKIVDEQGEVISNDYPAGSIPELLFWQNLPTDFIANTETISDILYGLLKISMKASDNAKRV